MKKTNKTTKKSSLGKKVKVGVAVGALGAAAYMLLGPDGKKNQAKIKSLANKIKKEVIKDTKTLVKSAKKVKNEVSKDAKELVKEAKKVKKEITKDIDNVKKKVEKKIKKQVSKWD